MKLTLLPIVILVMVGGFAVLWQSTHRTKTAETVLDEHQVADSHSTHTTTEAAASQAQSDPTPSQAPEPAPSVSQSTSVRINIPATTVGGTTVPSSSNVHVESSVSSSRAVSSDVAVDTSVPVQSASPTSAPSASQRLSLTISSSDMNIRLGFSEGATTSLTLKNTDSVAHTATIRELGIDSGSIAPGQTKVLLFTPTDSGTFKVRIS